MSHSTSEDETRTSLDRPFLVYTNFGGKNDFIAVKQFATREEAEDWIVYQSAERPAYYEVIHRSEFDTGSYH